VATLLLLPGLACDAALWSAQAAALAAHRPIVGDVHTRADTLPAMAELLLAEHPGELLLCGASMGGMLALHAALRAPTRVRGLALLGTSARADTPELLRLRSDAVRQFEGGRMDEVLRANIVFAFHPERGADPTLTGAYLAMIRRAGAAQLIRQNRAVMARADLRPRLHEIRCPTLVACGDADLLTPPECSHEIAAAIPGARFASVAECGHMATLEQPARVNALLLDWLAFCADA